MYKLLLNNLDVVNARLVHPDAPADRWETEDGSIVNSVILRLVEIDEPTAFPHSFVYQKNNAVYLDGIPQKSEVVVLKYAKIILAVDNTVPIYVGTPVESEHRIVENWKEIFPAHGWLDGEKTKEIVHFLDLGGHRYPLSKMFSFMIITPSGVCVPVDQ